MTVVNHVLNRIHVQRLLLAAALFGLSLSASAAGSFSQFMAVATGKSTAVKVASNGTPLATKATTNVTAGGGWTNAGNYGVAQGASGAVKVGVDTTVPVAGKGVPVTAVGSVAKDALIGAVVGGITGGVGGAVIGAATPIALDWLNRSGGRINPATGALERLDTNVCSVAPCTEFKVAVDARDAYYSTRDAACTSWFSSQTQVQLVGNTSTYRAAEPHVNYTFSASPVCSYNIYYVNGGSLFGENSSTSRVFSSRNYNPSPPVWLPSSLDDIAPYMRSTPVQPAVLPELDKAGATPQQLPITDIQVTGPAAVAGPATTTINNIDNSVKTTTTTNNYTYNGDTVTSGGQTVKNETTKADGTKTESTTSTVSPGDEAPAPEDPKTQCDKYPNSLGCAELDTPDADIPKDTKTVNFTAEDPFGGGKCPADVMASFRAIGNQSLKIVDWTTFCGMALPLRGLVLALASIMAFFIIMPGGVRE